MPNVPSMLGYDPTSTLSITGNEKAIEIQLQEAAERIAALEKIVVALTT